MIRGLGNRRSDMLKSYFVEHILPTFLKYVSRYALESPVPLADLIALSPGYRVLLDLATIPYTPLARAVCALGGRNIGSNVRNDVVGSVMLKGVTASCHNDVMISYKRSRPVGNAVLWLPTAN